MHTAAWCHVMAAYGVLYYISPPYGTVATAAGNLRRILLFSAHQAPPGPACPCSCDQRDFLPGLSVVFNWYPKKNGESPLSQTPGCLPSSHPPPSPKALSFGSAASSVDVLTLLRFRRRSEVSHGSFYFLVLTFVFVSFRIHT